MAQAEGFDARVVAAVEAVIDHDAHAEARAEGVAHQILVAFGAVQRFEPGVDLRQGSAQRLAVGEQVAVVVDEDRDAERRFEERTQRHAVAERREVGQIAADDAGAVVCRTGEGEADGHRSLGQLRYDFVETFDHSGQALVKVVRVRGIGDRVDDEFTTTHCAEHEVGTTCVESHDDTIVMLIHCSVKIKR